MSLRIVYLAFLVGSLIGGSEEKHFRGGYIAWSPVPGESRKVELYFRLNYRTPWFNDPANRNENGEDCTLQLKESETPITSSRKFKVIMGRRPVYLFGGRPPLYTCQDVEDGWSSGYNKTIITLPEQEGTVWTVGSDDCCWVNTLMNYDSPRRWRLRTTIDLTAREDNGLVNTSPRTDGLPIKQVLGHCSSIIRIAANDVDGDKVKCRWTNADKGECTTNCGNPDESIFSWKNPEESCEIVVNAIGADPGLYGVAVILEDFPVAGNSEPLSSISYQFLVDIKDKEADCHRITVWPGHGCYEVPFVVSPEFTMKLYAKTTKPSVPIQHFSAVTQPGMTMTNLAHDDGNAGQYFVVLSYTPTREVNGKVINMCYQAIDEDSITSQEVCLQLFVGGRTPEPMPSISTPSSNTSALLNLNTQVWHLYFTEDVQLSQEEPNNAAVTFLFMNGTVAHEVTINENNVANTSTNEANVISFVTPDFSLVPNTTYEIQLAEGVVTGTEGCLIKSKQGKWNFTTKPERPALRLIFPPPEVSVECNATFMVAYIQKNDLTIFDPSILSYNDPDCYGHEHNTSYYAVATMYGKCGTEAIPNEDHSRVSMVNNIYIPKPGSFVFPDFPDDPVLIRNQAYRVRVNCSIPAERLTYVEFTTNSSTIDIEEDVVGDSKFSLKMYPDATYGRPYRVEDFPIDAIGSDTLYFEAKTFNQKSKIALFLEECVATPTTSTSDSLLYPLIRDQCPLDNSVIFLKTEDKHVIRFSVAPFSFLGHNYKKSIFVHCRMRDCKHRQKSEKCNPDRTNCPELNAPAVQDN